MIQPDRKPIAVAADGRAPATALGPKAGGVVGHIGAEPGKRYSRPVVDGDHGLRRPFNSQNSR